MCVETTEDKKEGSFKNNELFVVCFVVFGEDGAGSFVLHLHLLQLAAGQEPGGGWPENFNTT